MKDTFQKFIKNLVIFTVIIAALQFLASLKLDPKWISNSWPFVILFFLSFTILMHRYLLKSTEGNPKKFVFAFLMMTTIKILLYLGVILVYVLLNRADAVAFIIIFFINYFLFTGFELTIIMKMLNKPKS
ncbi:MULTISPECIES: hypothetical protein [unclassified Lentimicrobium]|uniref:hypothetical protein n=1 Tax=unclassified Lentimicrobium TaxID=2677434 RepID=UPI001554B65F|nr:MULTISPECIES: hypothetical protein [unclassified Lentimicrobium]NPD46571.1 hypothetical protein [Lentimicrobium sp. S6]NPD85714.1 hypothetical protein [Lentimicrobium sp. L6]